MTAPETAGQAATCRAWHEWYDADHETRTMAQDAAESKYDAMHRAFHAGAIAAAAPAPAAMPATCPVCSAVNPTNYEPLCWSCGHNTEGAAQ